MTLPRNTASLRAKPSSGLSNTMHCPQTKAGRDQISDARIRIFVLIVSPHAIAQTSCA
jgi:hypothetical protein